LYNIKEYHQSKADNGEKRTYVKTYLITMYIFIIAVLIILRMIQNELPVKMFQRNVETYLYTQ